MRLSDEDAKALNKVIAGVVRRVIRSFKTLQDFEDLCHDVWVRVLGALSIRKEAPTEQLEYFVATRAYWEAKHWLRARRREKEKPQSERVEAEADERFVPGRGEERIELLWKALPQLPLEDRNIIEFGLALKKTGKKGLKERWAARQGRSRSWAFKKDMQAREMLKTIILALETPKCN